MYFFLFKVEQVPYEPSFGWVGRTSHGGDPYNINNRIGHTVPTYDPYQNYDEEIQQRNEFATDDIFHQDQFGFDYDRSGDEGLDGFGNDDIFFNAETQNNGHNQRKSQDYSGWYFGFMKQYPNFINIAFCTLDEYQVQDYEVAPRNEERGFSDFDSGDIFRTVPKPAITFGF